MINSERVDYGDPQGSLLGPKLFNMYVQSFASTMGSCIKKGFVSLYHLYCDTKSLIKARVEGYADNTAIRSKNSLILYLSFTSCLLASIISSMMQRNGCWNIFQLINSTLTLVMIVAKPSVQERIYIKGVFRWPLYSLVTEAKNLGVILDSICYNIEKKLSRFAMLHWYEAYAYQKVSL